MMFGRDVLQKSHCNLQLYRIEWILIFNPFRVGFLCVAFAPAMLGLINIILLRSFTVGIALLLW